MEVTIVQLSHYYYTIVGLLETQSKWVEKEALECPTVNATPQASRGIQAHLEYEWLVYHGYI